MQFSTLAKRGSLALFLAVVAFYFYGLGHLPLLGPDEPRYAQIAREMFLRGDLITPTLGGHPWFEKPALLYWMMMGSYKLFGVSEWSARFPAAVAGLLTVGAVFQIGRKVERSSVTASSDAGTSAQTGNTAGLGFLSALAAATSVGIVVFSRAASFDIIVTMTMTWALSFFLVSELEEKPKTKQRLLAGFYIFVGLSLLAKGLIGIVIPLGIIAAYYILRRRWPERAASQSLFWGIPLSLAVAALWYAPVTWRHGWPFVDQFFIQHQFARYISDKYRHPAPVYFYLLVLIPLSLPWTAFFIDGIWKAKSWRRRAKALPDNPLDKFLIFAFAWFLMPLLFFSFSSSKLPGYILPVLPSMALIAGERLIRIRAGGENRNWAIRLTGAVSVLMAVGVAIYAWRTGRPGILITLIVAAIPGVAGGLALSSVRYREVSVLLIAAATLGLGVFALQSWAPQALQGETSKHLLELANQRGYSQTRIYGLQRDDRSPEFYFGDRIAYGADREAVLYDGTASVIAESLTRKEALLVFVPLPDLGYFTSSKLAEIDVIGNNGRVALVAVKARQ